MTKKACNKVTKAEPLMKLRRVDVTFEECMEMGMSPTQKEVFLVIDEFWKKYGYSPSIREIAYVRGKAVPSTHRLIKRLVKLGVIKKMDAVGRTIRPAWVTFKHMKELE